MLADNYLADKFQNLSATLAGNKFELCLALNATCSINAGLKHVRGYIIKQRLERLENLSALVSFK